MKIERLSSIVKKRSKIFYAEKSRVILKPYMHGDEGRFERLITRVLNLSEEEVSSLLEDVLRDFASRHRYFRRKLENNFARIRHLLPGSCDLSPARRLLLGAYFSCEYSIEAAALFNPSMVPHPDQTGMDGDNVRFIMSFRATGEGHISSIEFRSGIIDENNDIFFDPLSSYVDTPGIHTDSTFNKHLFMLKLNEMGAANEVTKHVLDELPVEFTKEDLERRLGKIDDEVCFVKEVKADAVEMMRWLAKSNYEIKFDSAHPVSERVIFPVSDNESRGIEDARFVRFTDDNGDVTYYGPYTAYNGFRILPQIIETKDFVDFKINTLNGKAIQNKGMALFPKLINGKFAMLSRQDGENNHIMFSENRHFWQTSEVIQKPEAPWEFVQIGNCGPPIETEAGWLVLTHGVGPMRKYSIGVELLDLNDPTKIIGRIDDPILVPDESERDGYVPNVVYTCGAMIHRGELTIPYAMSDSRCGIATISVDSLLSRL